MIACTEVTVKLDKIKNKTGMFVLIKYNRQKLKTESNKWWSMGLLKIKMKLKCLARGH